MDFDDIKAWYELDEDEREAYEAYIEYEGRSASIEKFQEAYSGHFDTPEEFAEDLYYTEVSPTERGNRHPPEGALLGGSRFSRFNGRTLRVVHLAQSPLCR